MTYRDRRLAKADRLREWAGKREVKADVAAERVHQIVDMIPFGQPILKGHHSQRGAERDQERITSGMAAMVDNTRKASDFRSRADNIDAAAEHAIYSDDPDAIERLTERIAELEAEREDIKTKNTEFRKAHATEFKTLTAYQKDQVLPFPSYVLTNLTGNIARNKKRLTELTRNA